MQVVYDISVLGLSTLDARARTGVFRVVEHLADGLLRSNECDLRFCATGESFHPVYGALRYIDAHPAFGKVPFVSAGPLDRARAAAIERVLPLLDRPGGGLSRRVAGVAAGRLLRRAPRLDEHVLRGADVYHSPHAPLPEERVRGVQRFLTVYDLIGIFRPELFESGVGEYVERIVRSIGPDDWVACISEATKSDLCGYAGIDPDRVFVTPLAASDSLFHPSVDPVAEGAIRARHGVPHAPYLLAVNTLEPRKNLGAAVRAFAQIADDAPDLHLMLVGGRGWRDDALAEALAEAPNARSRIVFAGYVPDEHLAAVYSGAIAFVYPSLWEGFGLPVLEAMQCGVPVVTSNTSSLPEVVGDAGVMVDPMDVDALSEALLGVYSDSERRATLAARARARASEFSWERTVQCTLAAYRTAVDASRG